MKRTIIAALVLLCSAYAYADKAVYEAKYTDGTFPIVIDGDLNDWTEICPDHVTFTNFIPASANISIPSSDDLSGWFMCVADSSNIYVAVQVTDDILMTDINGFDRSSWDDIVEICFDGDLKNTEKTYFDSNDGQIMIVGGKSGLRWLAGRIPFLKILMPHYWDDAVGVKAGYLQSSKGYTVEVKIPLHALGHSCVPTGSRIGLNVRILEADDTANAGKNVNEGALSWADDPKLTSSWSTETYNQVAFTTKIDNSATTRTTVVATGEKELTVNVVVSDIDTVAGEPTVIDTINKRLATYDFAGASSLCSSVKDQTWAKCFLAALSTFMQDYTTAVDLLEEGTKNTDTAVSDWSLNFPREYSYYMLKSNRYLDFNPKYPVRPYVEVASFMNEWIKHTPADSIDNVAHVVYLLSLGSDNPENFPALEQLSLNAANQNIADQAKISLAKGYFYNNNSDMARKIANELRVSRQGSKAALDAEMVLMSIEEP